VTTEFDELITIALRDDARQAPVPDPGGFRPSAALRERDVVRTRWPRSLSLVAAAAGVVALLSLRIGSPDVAVVEQAWTPAGTEFTLRDLGPALSSMGVALAEVGRTIGVENHPNIVVSEELWPDVSPTNSEQPVTGPWELKAPTSTLFRCIISSGGAGCSPGWLGDIPDISQTSSVDNGVADFDLWIWANVPADAVFVSFTTGTGNELWQRPIAGVAAFPVEGPPPQNATITTYDRDGNALTTIDAWPDVEVSELRDTSVVLTGQQADTLRRLNDRVLSDCLTAAGVDFEPADESPRLGTLADPSVDPSVVWDRSSRRLPQRHHRDNDQRTYTQRLGRPADGVMGPSVACRMPYRIAPKLAARLSVTGGEHAGVDEPGVHAVRWHACRHEGFGMCGSRSSTPAR
jgi:hypothetical protein